MADTLVHTSRFEKVMATPPTSKIAEAGRTFGSYSFGEHEEYCVESPRGDTVTNATIAARTR
jgi:hypothetical protein